MKKFKDHIKQDASKDKELSQMITALNNKGITVVWYQKFNLMTVFMMKTSKLDKAANIKALSNIGIDYYRCVHDHNVIERLAGYFFEPADDNHMSQAIRQCVDALKTYEEDEYTIFRQLKDMKQLEGVSFRLPV